MSKINLCFLSADKNMVIYIKIINLFKFTFIINYLKIITDFCPC